VARDWHSFVPCQKIFEIFYDGSVRTKRPLIFAVTLPIHVLSFDFDLRFFPAVWGRIGWQWPLQEGQSFKAAPPIRRIWCTHTSQKTFSHWTHFIVACEPV